VAPFVVAQAHRIPAMIWQTTRFAIDLGQPRVMGIVNLTPDSFFDGGQHAAAEAGCRHCDRLLDEGADILDIGGESTRPGAHAVSDVEELARVLPVLRHAVGLGVPVSVDTSQARVIEAALDLGVDIVNDVRSLRRPGVLDHLVRHGLAGVCLMHMRGEPHDMAGRADYSDVVEAVAAELGQRLREVEQAGVARERVVLDPGIGFAKTPVHNLTLLARQRELLALGRPLLVGWSRKGTLGHVTGRAVGDRLPASLAAAVLALERGASVLRVHDVGATVDAVKLWLAVQTAADAWDGPAPKGPK
jgi:dihydropteroate synthase